VADALFAPFVTVIKSTPVASFIVLLLLFLGRDLLPVVIVVLMALPVIWGNVCAGIRNTDPLLLRTAKVFGFSRGRTLRRVYLPSVMPYFLSACRTALGLGWKSGIAAEVLTVPAVSIGKLLMEAKQYWEVTDLFAWTLAVILCSLVIEKVLMAAIGRLSRTCVPGGDAQ
jgi:NitT/TauT family transport system permease protein